MLKIVEIAWLVVSAISVIEIIRLAFENRFTQTFYLFVGCFFLGIFMFYFRRKQRIKYEERANQQEQ